MTDLVPKVNVRAAAVNDQKEIIQLITEIWRNEYKFNVTENDYIDLFDLEANYHSSGGEFLIAAINKTIIGTIALQKLTNKTYILKRMFVHKDYRGKGIAQLLLDQLLSLLKNKNLNSNCDLFLSTNESNAIAAKIFYLKNGFSVISKEVLPHRFPYFYEDDLFMHKNL